MRRSPESREHATGHIREERPEPFERARSQVLDEDEREAGCPTRRGLEHRLTAAAGQKYDIRPTESKRLCDNRLIHGVVCPHAKRSDQYPRAARAPRYARCTSTQLAERSQSAVVPVPRSIKWPPKGRHHAIDRPRLAGECAAQTHHSTSKAVGVSRAKLDHVCASADFEAQTMAARVTASGSAQQPYPSHDAPTRVCPRTSLVH
jgi:hypothetical protein